MQSSARNRTKKQYVHQRVPHNTDEKLVPAKVDAIAVVSTCPNDVDVVVVLSSCSSASKLLTTIAESVSLTPKSCKCVFIAC
mmetsp:Transcript_13416/g.21147  ORF Transcript_13416/g.21147 Transcript_13416/m.21147 type:complete len:82 (-) Transcript_13416:471-716(-)